MADENKKNALEMFNRLRIPSAMLVTSICFITVYSSWDLVRFFWFGYPLRETTLMITTTMGVVSMIGYILLGNGINKIRKYLS
jgi:hypothetical protein